MRLVVLVVVVGGGGSSRVFVYLLYSILDS